jgi:hypothetical protein
MAIIEKVNDSNLTGFGSINTYFLNKENGEKYSRVVGGFAWPGTKPGFCVVVVELKDKNEVHNKRPYRILYEREKQNPSALIKRCSELSGLFWARPFYADDTNEGMMRILQKAGVSLYVTSPPFLDDPRAFETYLLMIRELIIPTRKLLTFGKNSIFPNLLTGLNTDEIPSTAMTAFQKFPQITALGFAVSALEDSVYDPGEDARAEAANQELIETLGF